MARKSVWRSNSHLSEPVCLLPCVCVPVKPGQSNVEMKKAFKIECYRRLLKIHWTQKIAVYRVLHNYWTP